MHKIKFKGLFKKSLFFSLLILITYHNRKTKVVCDKIYIYIDNIYIYIYIYIFQIFLVPARNGKNVWNIGKPT